MRSSNSSSWKTRLLGYHDTLTRAGLVAGVAALGVILIGYCIEIVWRYFLNDPVLWANDTVRYMLACTLFLVLPAVTARREHVAISLLVEQRPAGDGDVLARVAAVAGACGCAVAGAFALARGHAQAIDGIQTIAMLPIPKWWLSALVCYGLWGSGLHFLRQAIHSQSRHGEPAPPGPQ
jgi:TRAP-type C4-dicarboxylate transport system permease small subunit